MSIKTDEDSSKIPTDSSSAGQQLKKTVKNYENSLKIEKAVYFLQKLRIFLKLNHLTAKKIYKKSKSGISVRKQRTYEQTLREKAMA